MGQEGDDQVARDPLLYVHGLRPSSDYRDHRTHREGEDSKRSLAEVSCRICGRVFAAEGLHCTSVATWLYAEHPRPTFGDAPLARY